MKLNIDVNNFKFEPIKQLTDLTPGWYLRRTFGEFLTLVQVVSNNANDVDYQIYKDLNPETPEDAEYAWYSEDLQELKETYTFARIEIVQPDPIVKQVSLREINRLLRYEEVRFDCEACKTVDVTKRLVMEKPLEKEDFSHKVYYNKQLVTFEEYAQEAFCSEFVIVDDFFENIFPSWEGKKVLELSFYVNRDPRPNDQCFTLVKNYLIRLTAPETYRVYGG